MTDTIAIEFWQQAKATRADVAIHLWGVRLHDIILRLERTRKHGVYTDQNGYAETVYLGGARGNRAAVYDRDDDATGNSRTVRIERRLKPRNPAILVPELASLPNPFAKMFGVATSVLRPLITEAHPDILFDSIRVRGFTKALKCVSRRQREDLKAALQDPAMPPTDQIWETWPDTLQRLGLLFPPDNRIRRLREASRFNAEEKLRAHRTI